jgi:oligopeptidase B
MSDPSIPLTTFEYDEWGNPANEDEYRYIKQYSPYDNIYEANYPAVFITSSLFDSQVQYFEPAKYTPKLREYNQSTNPILMKMNLIGGHGGLSGKINQFNEIAEEYNFIINLVD